MAIIYAVREKSQTKTAMRKVMNYVAQDKKTVYNVKLTIEYSNANTLPCRKEAIRAKIQCLRMERDGILERSFQASNHSS